MSEIRKVTMTVPISRELAIAYGMVEPTDEERARMDADAERAREWRQRQDERHRLAIVALRAKGDLEGRLLDLHRADERGECQGCDVYGAQAEQPQWPCRTVGLLAEHHGIELEEPWSL